MPYRNPVIPGFNPDPSICRQGDNYFLATSTFEYFPGVPIYTSKNLIDWRIIGHALNRPSQLSLRVNKAGVGINAPTLRYNRGKWYMTTAISYMRLKSNENDVPVQARGFYVWTDDIYDENKWSDPIYFDVTGIDQDLFFDDDGTVWHSWRKPVPGYIGEPGWFNSGVYIVQVDLFTGKSLGSVTLMRQNVETGNRCCEGPHVYKRDGWYYLSTADGGTEIDHQQHISRSKVGPAGPYEAGKIGKVNPMLHNGNDPAIQQTGHMDMIEDPKGRWWAVFLAVRPQKGVNSQLGRETFLLPIEWVDDWPIVNNRQRVSIEIDSNRDLPRSAETEEWSNDFHPDAYLTKQGWYQPRTPLKSDFDLNFSPGSLTIHGGPYTLADDEAISMLLKKQTCFIGRWTVTVDFKPQRLGEEAGVAVWWSKWSYMSLGIQLNAEGTGRQLVFRHPDISTDKPVFLETRSAMPVTDKLNIVIQAEPSRYIFSVTGADGESAVVGSVPASILVRERPFDSYFIGTFLGLYACGTEGVGTSSPAVFSDVKWKGIREGGA